MSTPRDTIEETTEHFSEALLRITGEGLVRYQRMVNESQDPEVVRRALALGLDYAHKLRTQSEKGKFDDLPVVEFSIDLSEEPPMPELVPTRVLMEAAGAVNADLDE